MEQELYKITNDIRTILNEIEAAEGELGEHQEIMLSQLSDALTHKTDDVVEWMLYKKDTIELAEKRLKEVTEIINLKKASYDRFKAYVASCMEALGEKKLEGKIHAITKRKPSILVEIFDETMINPKYINVPEPKPTIMKAEISKDLKNGIEVSGARLVESTKPSLLIK